MAHPNLTGAPTRRLLTAGIAAALFAVPLAGSAIALDVGALDDLRDKPLEELTPEERDELEELLELEKAAEEEAKKAAEAAAKEAAATKEKTTAAVKEVVDKATKGTAPAPPPPAEAAPAAPSGGQNDPQNAAGAGGPQPVNEPAPARTTPDRELANRGERPAFDQNGPIAPGLRSRTQTPSMQSFVPPPVVSAPFAFDLPQVADKFVSPEAPLVAGPAEVAAPTFASSTTPINDMVPDGVPGWLLATAGGLLLFVGGAIGLHAYDQRWKMAQATTTT